jgi:uncharacterized protein (TIRG00374 family)
MTIKENRPRSSLIWNLLKITLALALVAYVLSQTELEQLVSLRDRIDVRWLVLVVFLYALITLLKALQYHFMIGRQVTFPEVLNIVVIQNAATNFVAAGAGLASYLTLLRVEQGVRLSRSGVVFVLVKIWDLASVWLSLLVLSLFIWSGVDRLQALMVVALILVGISNAALLLLIRLRQKFVAIIRSFAAWTQLGNIALIGRGINILQSIAEQEQNFTMSAIGFGMFYSLLRMIVTMAWIYASMRSFSFDIGILPVAFVNILSQLISYLPIQVFGGLGVSETTSLYFYSFFNLPQTELAAVLIGQRLLFYATNLVMLLYLPLHAFLISRRFSQPET